MGNGAQTAVKIQTKRFGGWWLISIAALAWVFWASPENGTVLVYKLSMVTVGVLLAYLADRALFRNAPDITAGMLRDNMGAARLIARALVTLAVIYGLTAGI